MTTAPHVLSHDPRTALADDLEAAHRGEPWHGSSTRRLLEGVDAALAARSPGAGAHSIWETVLHMTGWVREVTRRLGGAPPGTPPEGDWPAVGEVSAAAWADAQRALDEAHDEVLAAIRRFPAERLGEVVGGSSAADQVQGVTYRTMIAGLAQHDAHHAGQVALLKRLLRSR